MRSPSPGGTDLLAKAKDALIGSVRSEQIYLARFAKAVEAFQTPIGLFNNLIVSDGELDLKKGGIFPIVHGVRALALEHGLTETTTVQRIARLVQANVLREDFGRDLTQSFNFLRGFGADRQLAEQIAGGSTAAPSSPPPTATCCANCSRW